MARPAGAEVGYRCAENMLHGCLHARMSLPAMAAGWDAFCDALRNPLNQLNRKSAARADST